MCESLQLLEMLTKWLGCFPCSVFIFISQNRKCLPTPTLMANFFAVVVPPAGTCSDTDHLNLVKPVCNHFLECNCPQAVSGEWRAPRLQGRAIGIRSLGGQRGTVPLARLFSHHLPLELEFLLPHKLIRTEEYY